MEGPDPRCSLKTSKNSCSRSTSTAGAMRNAWRCLSVAGYFSQPAIMELEAKKGPAHPSRAFSSGAAQPAWNQRRCSNPFVSNDGLQLLCSLGITRKASVFYDLTEVAVDENQVESMICEAGAGKRGGGG